jgi:hypothetical protein
MTECSPVVPVMPVSRCTDTLADILERVLDKGIVVAGDIVVNIVDIELLTLKVRLLVSSVQTARDLGIDWWESDPFLSIGGQRLERENRELRERIDRLEQAVRQAVSAAGGDRESDVDTGAVSGARHDGEGAGGPR